MSGAMGWRERGVDIAHFMQRPTFAAQPMAWGWAAALALSALLVLNLALGWLVSEVLALLDRAMGAGGGFLPAALQDDTTLGKDLIDYLVLAPLLEELVFRGWLTGRLAALRFAAYGFAALGLLLASLIAPAGWLMPLTVAAVVAAFTGLLHWGRTRASDSAVPAWFTRNFHWLVWGSSLAFGLIHLGNYEPLTHPLGLLVVLPQTIGGLLLAYTRTRLGLRAAMAHHAVFNALFLAGEHAW